MTAETILAIDQGTTSSRAILFSLDGDILDLKQRELTLHYPHKGWVEQNPEDIWADTLWACQEILSAAKTPPTAIGITNQRETTVIWDRETGKPIYNAIVWQDRRTADRCQSLKDAGHEDLIQRKTGLLLDPYFSATKMAWILDNVDGARQSASQGSLAFGTIDTYLLWRLTGGKLHATDVTNASRTMLYNIVDQKWDDELLALFNIPHSLLPVVQDCAADFGVTDPEIVGSAIQIGGIAGDQQAALIGQACFSPGMIKSTYGTGCFALMNIGDAFKVSQNRLLTTPAYRLNGKITYAIEGSIFVAGAAVQWLRDGLGLFDHAAKSEDMATSVEDNNGVYFVPAFTGLGAPYWQPDAKALITGLSRETSAAHIVRAALEAQAYQTQDLMGAMQADAGTDPDVIRADGGLVANVFVCQFLADMLGKPVEIPHVAETTAWGAACLAALHMGIFEDLEAISSRWRPEKRYEPHMSRNDRELLYKGWKSAVERVLL